MTNQVVEEGLRARKRAETGASLERAALELVARHGVENVTVDMICDDCMVSPRTFFNYFHSKEGALLGRSPRALTPEARRAFVESTTRDVLGELAALILQPFTETDVATVGLRRQIMGQYPELLQKQIGRITAMESEAVTLVLERFDHAGRVDPVPALLDEARMITALVGAIARYAMFTWLEDEALGPLEAVIARAVDLIRRTG
jgi:AcrR family transcriptional regulator